MAKFGGGGRKLKVEVGITFEDLYCKAEVTGTKISGAFELKGDKRSLKKLLVFCMGGSAVIAASWPRITELAQQVIVYINGQ